MTRCTFCGCEFEGEGGTAHALQPDESGEMRFQAVPICSPDCLTKNFRQRKMTDEERAAFDPAENVAADAIARLFARHLGGTLDE